MKTLAHTLMIGCAIALTPAAAHSQDAFSTLMAGGLTEAENWDIAIGGGLLFAPKYEGSKKSKVSALPYISFDWKVLCSSIQSMGSVSIFYLMKAPSWALR